MSQIDIIKESICYEQLLREGLTNQPIKGEYLLRDSQYPDMKEVLGVDVKATITNQEIIGDRVMVEGHLSYMVFYIAKEEDISDISDNKIHVVVFNDKLSNYIDLNDDEHNIVCNVECDVEHIEGEWMNERKVGISGLLTLKWEIYKIGEFEHIKDIEGKDDIQVKKEEEKLNIIKERKDIDLMGKSMMKVSMDKPEVEEILKCHMNIHKKEVKLVEDKVYIGCYCSLVILYKGRYTNELQRLEDDVYLSREEELPGVTQDMISALDIKVANEQHAINIDDVGECRVVNVEFSLKGTLKVYSDEKVEMLKDIYSPTMNMDIVSGEKDFTLIHSISNIEVTAKESLDINNGDNRIEEIILITGYPTIKDRIVENEKLRLEGVVKVNIIYRLVGEELNYGMINGNILFNKVVDITGLKKDMNVIVKPYLDSLDSEIEGNSVSVKANLTLNIKSYYKVNKRFIKEIIEGAEEVKEKKSSVTIYVVGEEESLWDLAKKYNTTVSELKRLNDLIEEENITPGCKLIIPGRAQF